MGRGIRLDRNTCLSQPQAGQRLSCALHPNVLGSPSVSWSKFEQHLISQCWINPCWARSTLFSPMLSFLPENHRKTSFMGSSQRQWRDLSLFDSLCKARTPYQAGKRQNIFWETIVALVPRMLQRESMVLETAFIQTPAIRSLSLCTWLGKNLGIEVGVLGSVPFLNGREILAPHQGQSPVTAWFLEDPLLHHSLYWRLSTTHIKCGKHIQIKTPSNCQIFR